MNKLKKQEAIDIENFDSINSHDNILEKIKFSFDTLCLIINEKNNIQCNNKLNSINNIIELKNIINDIVKSENNNDLSVNQFIENINNKIDSMSNKIYNNLKKFIENSLTKIDKNSNTIKRKLQKKICIIKNTMTNDSKVIKILQSKNITMDNCEMITPPPKIAKVIKKNKRNSTDEYKIQNDDVDNDKKSNKKYKGEMKRNFVEEYHDNLLHDNMRKQVWPSFKNKKQSKNHENNKAKNQPISPDGEVCYKKKSCFKKNDNKHDDKILDDNIDNWQFKRYKLYRKSLIII